MKYLILFLIAFNSFAADLSIYSVSASSDSDCCTEYSNAEIDVSIQNDVAGWSMFYVNDGGGLSGFVHHKINNFDIKTGLMFIPYSATASPAIGYPQDRYSSTAFAPFIGVKYSHLSVMIVYYDSSAIFSSSVQTGVDISNRPVFHTETLDAPSKSMLYMIGITIPFTK